MRAPSHLNHEVPDAAMEQRIGVVAHVAQCQEVLAGARHDVAVQLDVDVTYGESASRA